MKFHDEIGKADFEDIVDAEIQAKPKSNSGKKDLLTETTTKKDQTEVALELDKDVSPAKFYMPALFYTIAIVFLLVITILFIKKKSGLRETK